MVVTQEAVEDKQEYHQEHGVKEDHPSLSPEEELMLDLLIDEAILQLQREHDKVNLEEVQDGC